MRQQTMLRMGGLCVLLFLLLLLLKPEGMQAKTACAAITPFSSKKTHITCYFYRDISAYGFNVQFFNVESGTTETALACNRKEPSGFSCHKEGGVEFNESQPVTYTLTFTRDSTINQHGSQYQCQFVPFPADETAERCTVLQIDLSNAQPTLPEAKSEDQNSSATIGVYILLSIIIIVVVVIIIGCVIMCIKRERIPSCWEKYIVGVSIPSESDREKARKQKTEPRVPVGWPSYFYNLGWNEALTPDSKTANAKDAKSSQTRSSTESDHTEEKSSGMPLLPQESSRPESRDAQERDNRSQSSAHQGSYYKGSTSSSPSKNIQYRKQEDRQSWPQREEDQITRDPQRQPMLAKKTRETEQSGASNQIANEEEDFKDVQEDTEEVGKIWKPLEKKLKTNIQEAAQKAKTVMEKAEKQAQQKEDKAKEKSGPEKEKAVKEAAHIRKQAKVNALKTAAQKAGEIIKQAEKEAKSIESNGKKKTESEKKQAAAAADRIRQKAKAIADQLKQQVIDIASINKDTGDTLV